MRVMKVGINIDPITLTLMFLYSLPLAFFDFSSFYPRKKEKKCQDEIDTAKSTVKKKT